MAEGGGGRGTRTPDLYSAIVALSQLSYAPTLHRHAVYQKLRPETTSRNYASPLIGVSPTMGVLDPTTHRMPMLPCSPRR